MIHEIWSFVRRKENKRRIWIAIDATYFRFFAALRVRIVFVPTTEAPESFSLAISAINLAPSVAPLRGLVGRDEDHADPNSSHRHLSQSRASREPGSIPAENRRMRDVLENKGYTIVYSEFTGGHDYLNWHGSLADGPIALACRET